jgi:hypothetical protein
MAEQLEVDLKFHPELKQYPGLFQNRNEHSLEQNVRPEPSQLRTSEKSSQVPQVLVKKYGKYELLYEGFYPLLHIELREDFEEKIFSKRYRFESQANLWTVESQRLAKLAANSGQLYSRSLFGAQSVASANVQFHCECYGLEKVRMVPSRVIVTDSHLM